jgi:hypothetical protein
VRERDALGRMGSIRLVVRLIVREKCEGNAVRVLRSVALVGQAMGAWTISRCALPDREIARKGSRRRLPTVPVDVMAC